MVVMSTVCSSYVQLPVLQQFLFLIMPSAFSSCVSSTTKRHGRTRWAPPRRQPKTEAAGHAQTNLDVRTTVERLPFGVEVRPVC